MIEETVETEKCNRAGRTKRMIAALGMLIAVASAGLLLTVNNAGAQNGAPAATGAATPKFSTFAPAEDLSNELNLLVADLEKAVADEDEYKSQIDTRFLRDGNMIALVATALGLHDQDNSVKPHAAAIVAAAHKLSEAEGYAATKKAVEDVKAALTASSTGSVHWGKIVPLKSLMKDQVPSVNTKIKTGLRHFADRTKAITANAAMMALIAENAKLCVGDTKKPNEGPQWTAHADQLRAAAVNISAKLHAGDKAGANAAMNKLNESCHACHAIFNPDANDKE